VALKKIETHIGRKGDMLPCCPNCDKAIFLEEINCYTNKEMELRRREAEKDNNLYK